MKIMVEKRDFPPPLAKVKNVGIVASLISTNLCDSTSSYTRMSTSIFLPSLLPRNLFHEITLAPLECTSKPFHEGKNRKYSYGAKPAGTRSGEYISALLNSSTSLSLRDHTRRSISLLLHSSEPVTFFIHLRTSYHQTADLDQDVRLQAAEKTNPHTRCIRRLYLCSILIV